MRNVSKENCHVRIGLDSGGDFMKITMNVIDKSKHTADNRRCSGDSDTSVDKLFMIGFVKKIPETHYNMKQMLSEIDIASLLVDYTYCGDQKMLNILAGIKNHASKFPCPYCDAKKLFLDNEKAEIRTLHRLTEDLASESKCVVNPCLLVGKPEDSILELFPPPALHFKLRCVNYLCDNLSREWMIVRPELSTNPVIQFTKDQHIVRMNYHGGGYEGNQCNRILQKAELLAQIVPESLKSYTDCMIAFRELQDSCFGWKVEQDYATKVENFRENYKDLLINITPTVHSTFEHILDWFELKGTEFGLALYSEQALESSHSNFLTTVWEKGYKLPDTHPKYSESLLGAVAKYNSRHLLDY